MKRQSKKPLPTPAELKILKVLWDLTEGTIDEVIEHDSSRPNYKTVQTLLRIMEQKGFVRHRVAGRAFVFEPSITRKLVERRSLTDVLQRNFGGSPVELVVNLLETRQVNERELDELESLIRRYKRTHTPGPE